MGLFQRSWDLNRTLLLVGGRAEKSVCPVLPSLVSLLHIKGHSDAWEADTKSRFQWLFQANNSGSSDQEEKVLTFSVLTKSRLDVQILPTTSAQAAFEDIFLVFFLVLNMFVPFCSRRAASAP